MRLSKYEKQFSRSSIPMHSFRPTRRDALLLLIGGASILLCSKLLNPPLRREVPQLPHLTEEGLHLDQHFATTNFEASASEPTSTSLPPPHRVDVPVPVRWHRKPDSPLPYTRIVEHAPGWTLFQNLYMSNGTLYVVRSGATSPEDEGWSSQEPPELRMILSSGLESINEPANIANREPGPEHMSFIDLDEANDRWQGRAWGVEGVSWMVNDPPQFLTHYYHWAAETFFGLWTFYAGVTDSHITAKGHTKAPPPARAIFHRCSPGQWRDESKLNGYILRSMFPSINVEVDRDWQDRIFMTRDGTKAWLFESVLLADRSASFRGQNCGKNHRIASEAWEHVRGRASKWWWEPVRRAVLTFAGVPEETLDLAIHFPKIPTPTSSSAVTTTQPPPGQPIVITYINRQGGRRCLIETDHQELVKSLSELAARKGWEFNDVKAQSLSKEEQLRLAAKTTILVGVHGNGLTHLLMMAPTEISTVIEIFYPGGFTHDYEWTTRALGMRHYAIWNDTWSTYPKHPAVDYPEGFQGQEIPVHGPSIAQIVEDRIEGRMP